MLKCREKAHTNKPYQFSNIVLPYSQRHLCSEEEYSALRAEITQRTIIVNNISASIMSIMLTMWGAGFGLIGIQFANQDSLSEEIIKLLVFSEIAIFFMSLLLMIPFASKSNVNLKQILSISAYIQVFSDFFSLHNTETDSNTGSGRAVFAWETINLHKNLSSASKNILQTATRFFMPDHDLSFCFMGTMVPLLIIVTGVINIKWICKDQVLKRLCLIILIISVIIAVCELPAFLSKRIKKLYPTYLKIYLAYAVRIGLLKEADLVSVWQELSTDNTISVRDFDESFYKSQACRINLSHKK